MQGAQYSHCPAATALVFPENKLFPKQTSGSLLIGAGKKADILINPLKVADASPIRTGETCKRGAPFVEEASWRWMSF